MSLAIPESGYSRLIFIQTLWNNVHHLFEILRHLERAQIFYGILAFFRSKKNIVP